MNLWVIGLFKGLMLELHKYANPLCEHTHILQYLREAIPPPRRLNQNEVSAVWPVLYEGEEDEV